MRKKLTVIMTAMKMLKNNIIIIIMSYSLIDLLRKDIKEHIYDYASMQKEYNHTMIKKLTNDFDFLRNLGCRKEPISSSEAGIVSNIRNNKNNIGYYYSYNNEYNYYVKTNILALTYIPNLAFHKDSFFFEIQNPPYYYFEKQINHFINCRA